MFGIFPKDADALSCPGRHELEGPGRTLPLLTASAELEPASLSDGGHSRQVTARFQSKESALSQPASSAAVDVLELVTTKLLLPPSAQTFVDLD